MARRIYRFCKQRNVNANKLQSHLEMTEKGLQQMVQNGENELTDGRYIQHAEEIRAARDHLQVINNALFGILDRLPSCGQ